MDSPYVDECRVYVRRGGYYTLMPNEHNPILKAWKAGDTFYSAQGIDGEIETLKLAEVEAIMYFSAEKQERARIQRNAVRAYEEQEWTP